MKLIAFDPSLRNLGVAVGELVDNQLRVSYVNTFYLDKLVDECNPSSDWDVDPNTLRTEMLEFLGNRLLTNYTPDIMVIELPIFNGKNPKSLQVQMKAIVTLEVLAHKFSSKLKTNIVEYMPNVIKQGVGLDPRKVRGDKDAITKALLKLVKAKKLVYLEEDLDPNHQDEHANDAVAMLYTKAAELMALLD